MSLINSKTTADFIPWDSAISLVHKLYKDKNYVMSLFVACGIFMGLRVRDLRALRWNQLLQGGVITITEHKTKKDRQIKLRNCTKDSLITEIKKADLNSVLKNNDN